MQYRDLGKTGVRVSELCFGTMAFGGDADQETSAALFARCRDEGINFFDCANVYAAGRSEAILGALAESCRDELILASKAFFPTVKDDPNARGASRRHLVQAVEDSLRRLRTDRIDLFLVHRFDERTGLEETLRALDDLVRAGKIVYVGASNFAAWQVAKALGLSARNGWASFACVQPMYNLLKRQAEVEILPMSLSEGLAVTPYSPLGGGLLTGKYENDAEPVRGRLVENAMYAERYGDAGIRDTVRRFVTFARDGGYEPAGLAVAWVASHPAVTAPIIGARNPEQLEASLRSVDIELTDETRAEIGALSPEPPPATDRSEERRSADPTSVVIQGGGDPAGLKGGRLS